MADMLASTEQVSHVLDTFMIAQPCPHRFTLQCPDLFAFLRLCGFVGSG